jgi:hypothetical protein
MPWKCGVGIFVVGHAFLRSAVLRYALPKTTGAFLFDICCA